MSDFKPFSVAVHAQFTAMSKHELFVVDINKDALYEAYLAAFPEGTNPIFRERTEHDCSCCRNFIKNIGNVVAIVDGMVMTVWDDVEGLDRTYYKVTRELARIVRNAPIVSLFRSSEPKYGAATSVELLEDKSTRTWNHFHGTVAAKHFTKDVGTVVGDYNTTCGVFKRGLNELKPEAFNTVLDLISSNNLYKGNDFLAAISAFKQAQYTYLKQGDATKANYIWANAGNMGISRFRNTAIGTLLVDLSGTPEYVDDEGETTPAKPPLDLEDAVKRFEVKVAPTNYKRPNALITQKMVDDAMKTINELGLEEALERRFATISDVSVNDILFVDNAVRGKMKGGVANILSDAVTPLAVDTGKAQDISEFEFVSRIVPNAKSIDVQVKNSHQNNFVSITAPVHADVAQLFKWENNFAWSYDGNVTDSIKERVKAAGGKTDAVFRASLAWFNHDDLDLHAIEPDRNEIYFGNRSRASANTGQLDVDMNCGYGSTREPVENIVWTNPKDGVYKIVVHNYSQRETNAAGYTLEIEFKGELHHYSSKVSPRSGGKVEAILIELKGGKLHSITADKSVEGGSFSQEKWGVTTEKFTRVDTLMLSPNHWGDNQAGAKHLFFILEGCYNPVPTRGIYNEFLASGLEKHRKVFETLGNKLMCQPTPSQLSGVGFTAARGDSVVVKVDGKKLYNIKF